MTRYLFTFRGGQPYGSTDAQQHLARWNDWIECLGEAVLDPGRPLTATEVIDAQGQKKSEGPDMNGYAIIEARNMSKALSIAESCPHRALGEIYVSEMGFAKLD
ncbi:MAG: hypothetical protein ACU0DW_09010 [Shimia sp.]